MSANEKPYQRGKETLFILRKLINQFFHRVSKSNGSGSSQSIFLCHDNWIICLGSIIAGIRIPNGSKIELTKLRKPRFVIGISFCNVLTFSKSFSASHRTPNVLCIWVFCQYKSTIECFWETLYGKSSFKTFGLLEINLVSLNPPRWKSFDDLYTCIYCLLCRWKRVKIIVHIKVFGYSAGRTKTNLIFIVFYSFLECPVYNTWQVYFSEKVDIILKSFLFEILLKLRLNYLISLILWKDFHLQKLIGIQLQHWKLLSLSGVYLHFLHRDEEYNLCEVEFV